MTDNPRAYSTSLYYPTEGEMTSRQFETLLRSHRDSWDSWLARVTKNGPTDVEGQQGLLLVGSIIYALENTRRGYFHYKPEEPDAARIE